MGMVRKTKESKNASIEFIMRTRTNVVRPSRIRPFVPEHSFRVLLSIIPFLVSMPIFTQPAHARRTAAAAFVPSSRTRESAVRERKSLLQVLPNSDRNSDPSSLPQQAQHHQSSPSSSTRQPPLPPQRRKPKHLVLVGGGHAHVQVIKALRHRPDALNWRVTLIDAQTSASYSGMVPGSVAGIYTPDQTQLHLPPLAAHSRIDFVHGRVVDIDLERRLIYVQHKDSNANDAGESSQPQPPAPAPPIHFDAVSLDIGSTARGLDATPGARQFAIPTRPIDQLVRRLEEALQQQKQKQSSQQQQQGPVQLVVVGGGAAGLELALSVTSRWRRELAADGNGGNVECTVLDAGRELLPGENERARATLRAVLRERGIRVRHRCHVTAVRENVIELRQGRSSSSTPHTHCLWAAGAAPHSLAHHLAQRRGLDCDKRGWIRVAPTLQSTSHAAVFAAGDCATLSGLPDDQPSPPKAGVYAVRAGPILIENLTKYLASLDDDKEEEEEDHPAGDNSSDDDDDDDDEPTTINDQQQTQNEDKLKEYAPQDDFLKLLACGDGTALGFRFGLALRGKWVFQLKDDIDQSFMNLFDVSNFSKEQPQSSSSSSNDHGNQKWYKTRQYDDTDDSATQLPAPRQAAELLQRTDDHVDYRVAKLILRTMGRDETYRKAVLEHCHQDEAAYAAMVT